MPPSTTTPPQTPQLPPPLNSDMPPSAPKDKKSLGIALVVAGVLLLGAIGIGLWLMSQKNTDSGNTVQNTITNQNTEDTADVKTVAWVAPTDIPSSLIKNEQNTEEVSITYYADIANNCGITSNITPLTDKYGTTSKDVITNAANAAEASGIKTSASTDGADASLKDADGSRSYAFNTVDLEQDIAIEGVPFTKQYNSIMYKQFGQYVASLGVACAGDTWEAQKTVLLDIAKKFTLKTER